MDKQLNIRKKLNEMLCNPLINESEYSRIVLGIVYDEHKEDTMAMFVQIQEKDKKRLRKEELKLKMAVENSMHSFIHIAKALLENKTSHKAKAFAKYAVDDDDITYLIDTCKVYFPDGKAKYAAPNAKWFLDKFIQILKKHKDKWIEGGSSRDWAVQFGHAEYIDLVLSQIED